MAATAAICSVISAGIAYFAADAKNKARIDELNAKINELKDIANKFEGKIDYARQRSDVMEQHVKLLKSAYEQQNAGMFITQ